MAGVAAIQLKAASMALAAFFSHNAGCQLANLQLQWPWPAVFSQPSGPHNTANRQWRPASYISPASDYRTTTWLIPVMPLRYDTISPSVILAGYQLCEAFGDCRYGWRPIYTVRLLFRYSRLHYREWCCVWYLVFVVFIPLFLLWYYCLMMSVMMTILFIDDVLYDVLCHSLNEVLTVQYWYIVLLTVWWWLFSILSMKSDGWLLMKLWLLVLLNA